MANSGEAFYYREKHAANNRVQLQSILIVLCMNAIVLLSLTFNFRWWERYPFVTIVISLLYVISLIACHEKSHGTLFSDLFRRFKDKRDYYKGDGLAASSAPVREKDYIFIYKKDEEGRSYPEYLQLFLNKWDMEIIVMDIVRKKPKYVIKGDRYDDFNDLVIKTETKIEEDGYQLLRLYDEFGVLKWEQSEEPEPPSRKMKVLYTIWRWTWNVLSFIVIVAPLVPLLIYIYNLSDD